MFCYSPIVPGVYVLLFTDCTWSLCFVTHRLYQEYMFCYLPIVPGVYVLLLTEHKLQVQSVSNKIKTPGTIGE
jgi:hypothetical protein